MGDDALFTMVHGERPLLVSVPHAGTLIPDWLRERLTAAGRAQRDADFGVPELYREALPAGCSLLTARYSRYLVDLNRAPDDRPLYPGRFETGICPLSSFAGEPLYREGQEPDAAERRERIERYWRPYHEALQSELDRLRQRHRRVLLWDAHSIRGRLPLLFEGSFPISIWARPMAPPAAVISATPCSRWWAGRTNSVMCSMDGSKAVTSRATTAARRSGWMPCSSN